VGGTKHEQKGYAQNTLGPSVGFCASPRGRGGSKEEAPWAGVSLVLRCGGIKRKPRLGARGFHWGVFGVGPGGVSPKEQTRPPLKCPE
jgi:hypothetical protein